MDPDPKKHPVPNIFVYGLSDIRDDDYAQLRKHMVDIKSFEVHTEVKMLQ